MSFPPGNEMFQFPGFALILLFYSENKSLLLISVGPKTAPSPPKIIVLGKTMSRPAAS